MEQIEVRSYGYRAPDRKSDLINLLLGIHKSLRDLAQAPDDDDAVQLLPSPPQPSASGSTMAARTKQVKAKRIVLVASSSHSSSSSDEVQAIAPPKPRAKARSKTPAASQATEDLPREFKDLIQSNENLWLRVLRYEVRFSPSLVESRPLADAHL